ncbi:alpha/beta fold hydrolase [Streptomyces sp. NPDC059009]|uniref:alpha/beta fold hydrolase n=1 Tax=Streptomyces sp. NPDC059009 TaxID=3346694 RepID=UPI003697193B
MSWFEFDGIRVWYERRGSGTPLVFLHNAGTSHELWHRQIAHFGERYDVIAPDLVGYGRSDRRPDDPHDQGLYLRMLEHLVDELDLDRFVLVGNCIGSATSVRYAERHPERVAALVLINVVTARIATAGGLGPVIRLQRNARRRPLLRRAAGLRLPWRLQAPVFRRLLFGRGGDRAFMGCLSSLYRDPGQTVSLVKLGEDIGTFGPLERSRALAGLPICVLHGEDNRVLPLGRAAGTIRALAPDERHVIAGGGHVTPTQNAREVNEIVDGFLAAHVREEDDPAAARSAASTVSAAPTVSVVSAVSTVSAETAS